MAWPFTTAPAPNFSTGLVAIPTSLTVVTAGSPWVMGMRIINTTGALITIKVTNTAGLDYVPTMEVPANMVINPLANDPPFMDVVGLKWIASAAGLNGQIWGYV